MMRPLAITLENFMAVGFLAIVALLFLSSIVIASIIFFRKAQQMERQQQLPPGYGNQTYTPAGRQLASDDHSQNLMNLRLNDIVSYFGQDYIIEGRLNYWEDGYTWTVYMLVDGEEVKWLAVEEDDSLEVSMWEDVNDLRLSPNLPEFVEYRGVRYRMTERGQARVNQQGRTRNKTGLSMEYASYESRDADTMLSVEIWSGEVEVSIGQEINPATLDILPGDQVQY